jgi:predicted transcriptional regulator of viral defense system
MGIKGKELLVFFKRRGGVVPYAAILKAGFHKGNLKALIASGHIQKLDRGVYKLSELDDLANPDLVIAAIRAPKGVVCLLSSLAYYEVTDEIPRNVNLAIPRGTHANKIKHPPVKYYRFTLAAWKAGIETKKLAVL